MLKKLFRSGLQRSMLIVFFKWEMGSTVVDRLTR